MTQSDETEVLDQTTDEEVIDQPEVEEEQPEGAEGQEAAEGEPEADADEVVVTIGDEPASEEPAERAPEWVRDLRKKNQETVRENRELKKQLDALKAAPAEKSQEVGEEPSLEGCEYDEDKFKAEWKAWNQRQAERSEQERKKQEQGAKAQAEWNEKVNAYEKAKGALKVKDVAEAEAEAFEVLSQTQRGVILDATENAALVIYALGKNPKKAQELAAITNPIKFAVAIHDLEKQMKVTPRKSAPIPDAPVRGGARIVGGADSKLDQLREKAAKTGDMSEVVAYKNQMKAQKRA